MGTAGNDNSPPITEGKQQAEGNRNTGESTTTGSPQTDSKSVDHSCTMAAADKWKRGRIVGIGGFSSVYVATKEDDGLQFAVKSVAMKCRDRDFQTRSLDALRNEIKLLGRLRSKYIVRYLGHGYTKSTDLEGRQQETLDMYLEYWPKGSLKALNEWHNHNRRGPMPEAWMAVYTMDVLRALEYLHKNQIVHGDIKGENIVFGSDCAKLVDFGSAKDCCMSKTTMVTEGTICYMAPEVANKVESTFASDVFSLGCTVIEMVTGQPPVEALEGKEYCKPIPKHISKEARDFLQCCLKTDPKLRFSASQLLNHLFILKNGQQYDVQPRTKHSNMEFPYDCSYFDRCPSEENCYRVPFVDEFQYSGPGLAAGQSSEDFALESQLNQELHGGHGMALEKNDGASNTMGMSNPDSRCLGFMTSSKSSKSKHSTTNRQASVDWVAVGIVL